MAAWFIPLMLMVMVVCLRPSGTAAVNPGFKARITKSGLDYLEDVGMKILEEEIKNLRLPDLTGDGNVALVGRVSFTVSNIRITEFAIPSSTIATRDGVGLVLQASGLTVSVSGNWYYTNHGWFRIRDRGTFDGSMSQSSLALTLRIGVDRSGRPTVSSYSRDCSFNAGRVSVRLHGGASWLYNLFSDSINDAIRSALQQETCSMVINGVNTDLQNQFSRLQTQIPLSRYAVVDYSFVAPPIFFDGNVDTSHKGEVFRTGFRDEAPYTPPVISPGADDSRYIFLWVTDYLIESAGYVYYQTGLLSHTVTQGEMPPGVYRDNFNTSAMMVRFILPEVGRRYPNKLMQVDVRVTAPPVVNIDEINLNVSIDFDLDFYVTLPDKPRLYLFTLDATVHGPTQLACNYRTMTWETGTLKIDVGLKRSTVGEFNLKFISIGIDLVFNRLILPWINEMGESGLPLPTSPNIRLVRPVISQGKGFIKIGTDILFRQTA